MSIKQQIGSGVAWMSVGNWIEQAVNFLVFVILARLLGAEAFGLLAMATAFVIMSEFLVRETLSEYLIKTETLNEGHLNAAFWMLVALGSGLAVILIVISGPVAQFYEQADVKKLIQVLSLTALMIAPAAVPVAVLRRELRFRSLALRAIAGVVAGGVVAVWMALNGYGVWSLAGQRLVQVLVNVVMAWFAVSWRPGLSASRQDFKDIWGFGSKVLGLRASDIARTQLPIIIIGATAGPTVLGLFSIAWRLVEIASFLIVTPIRMVSQPAFAAMTRQGDNASELLVEISSLSGLIAFPAFFGLSALSGPVLILMFGDKWIDAIPILSIIAFVGVYLSIEMVNQSFCLAAGKVGAITVLAWIEVAIGGLLIWAVSGMGIVAMSVAFVASYLILWTARYWIVAGIAHLRLWSLLSIHIAPLAGAFVMVLGIYAQKQSFGDLPPIAALAAGVVVGGVIYGVWTLIFMGQRILLIKSFIGARGGA